MPVSSFLISSLSVSSFHPHLCPPPVPLPLLLILLITLGLPYISIPQYYLPFPNNSLLPPSSPCFTARLLLLSFFSLDPFMFYFTSIYLTSGFPALSFTLLDSNFVTFSCFHNPCFFLLSFFLLSFSQHNSIFISFHPHLFFFLFFLPSVSILTCSSTSSIPLYLFSSPRFSSFLLCFPVIYLSSRVSLQCRESCYLDKRENSRQDENYLFLRE